MKLISVALAVCLAVATAPAGEGRKESSEIKKDRRRVSVIKRRSVDVSPPKIEIIKKPVEVKTPGKTTITTEIKRERTRRNRLFPLRKRAK